MTVCNYGFGVLEVVSIDLCNSFRRSRVEVRYAAHVDTQVPVRAVLPHTYRTPYLLCTPAIENRREWMDVGEYLLMCVKTGLRAELA